MSAAWRRAAVPSASSRSTATRPRAARSPLTRHATAASTVASGAVPTSCAADGQGPACAPAGGAASAVTAATATARTKAERNRRAGGVGTGTRRSAAGPRGGVPGIPAPCRAGGRVHKTTVVLRPDPTKVGLVDEAVAPRPQRRLQAVVDADLAEDVAEVALDRLRADPEPEGDLLVGHAGPEEGEDVALAVADGLGRAAGAALLDERRGDARGERRPALRRGLDPRDQLLGLGVLEQVAGGARVERGGDPPTVGERRQHDDARAALPAADRARRLDAVHDRHLQIHQDDVGIAVPAAVDGLLAVARDAHDLDAVAGLEQAGDPDADDLVVVGDQDTDRPGLRGGRHTL